MYRNDDFKNIAKILIFAVLCNVMHTSYVDVPKNETFSPVDYLKSYPEAALENSKYHASIRLKVNDYNFGHGHICSGVLIASSVVLTSAHCTYNYDKSMNRHPSEMKIVLGLLNRFERSKNSLIHYVTHIHTPSTFNPKTLQDNIAILLLDRDIPRMHAAVQPIALKDSFMKDVNMNYQLTSWGLTEQNMPIKNVLSMNATQMNPKYCSEQMQMALRDGESCIRIANRIGNVIPSDAGAPLISNNYLIGMLSYATADTSTIVYTNIMDYHKWISNIIGDGKNQNSSIWGTLLFIALTLYSVRISKFVKQFY